MNLYELVARHGRRAKRSVPDWMLGMWKRYSISFANGFTDLQTHVCWLQSRNFTIDLRLPLEMNQVPLRPLAEYSERELQVLANYEGWTAVSEWDGRQLSWHDTDVSYQLHNRWPEPAILQRTGNCMIEHCASNAYVEDWRLQPSRPGPLIGLQMIEEREVDGSGKVVEVRRRGGALIVSGDYAALVLGRAEQPYVTAPLRQLVADAANAGDMARLAALLDFETSVGRRNHDNSNNGNGADAGVYSVLMSTVPGRVGEDLFAADGFEMLADGTVRQSLEVGGVPVERLYAVDTLEAEVLFEQTTHFSDAAAIWYAREAPTLTHYLDILR